MSCISYIFDDKSKVNYVHLIEGTGAELDMLSKLSILFSSSTNFKLLDVILYPLFSRSYVNIALSVRYFI